jgi:uncharacterized protein (TIGR02145 family)
LKFSGEGKDDFSKKIIFFSCSKFKCWQSSLPNRINQLRIKNYELRMARSAVTSVSPFIIYNSLNIIFIINLIFEQMKRIFFLMLTLLIMSVASMNAQVRIGGTDDPNPSAVLDLNATDAANNGDLGLALPRVQLTSTDNPEPLDAFVKGMTVYNTLSTGDVIEGTYYCDGARWVKVRNSTELINKSDLSVELSNLIAALAKAGVPSSITCPPSVTGSSSTIYAVGNFGAAGCWMIDNSKEGTPSATHYMEGLPGQKPEGLAGYYYTWEQAKGACPDGFLLPTNAQLQSLRTVVNNNVMALSMWLLGGTQGQSFGGRYSFLIDEWAFWGELCSLWVLDSASYSTTTPVAVNVVAADRWELACTVRCIKN